MCTFIYLLYFMFGLMCINVNANIQKKVIGGIPVEGINFPYILSLKAIIPEDRKYSYCGGTLISDRWILSAAHCFAKISKLDDPKRWIAKAEAMKVKKPKTSKEIIINANISTLIESSNFINYQLRKELAHLLDKLNRIIRKKTPPSISKLPNKLEAPQNPLSPTEFQIKNIFKHPKYIERELEYDIAIVQLKESLQMANGMSLANIKLPDLNSSAKLWPTTGKQCIFVGFGCNASGLGPSSTPISTPLKVVSHTSCNMIYRYAAGLNKNHEFCAGYYRKNIGICQGDSGSGLFCQHNGESVLMGVASATHNYDPANYPALFTRVAYFSKWINQITMINKQ